MKRNGSRRHMTMWTMAVLLIGVSVCSTSAAPGDKPSGKVVTSFADLLDELPPELRPDPKQGWLPETRQKAKLWLMKNASNRPCRIVVPLRQISYYKKPDKREPGRDWELVILFGSTAFDFQGVSMSYGIQAAPAIAEGEVIFRATNAQEQMARKLNPERDKIAISGVIAFYDRIGGDALNKHASIHVKVVKTQVELHPDDKSGEAISSKVTTGSQGKPDAKVDTKTDAINPIEARPFNAWPQMFDGLPANAAPAAGKGWDRETFKNVSVWFRANAAGRTIRLSSKVATISVSKDPLEKDPSQMWVAKVRLTDGQFTYRGFEIGTTVHADNIHGFLIRGDEAFGKRMQNIKEGHPLTVQGTIRTALIAQVLDSRAEITLSLKDYSIPSLK